MIVVLDSGIWISALHFGGTPLVALERAHGNLVVKAARRKYNGKHLIFLINVKNRHGETEWGQPTGKEIW
ncbi:MAG TPA: hypothetical protein VKM93_24520 [Terriglobia bacterium]|nr:hypothetical protein [Terriglobia bacterium]